MLELDTWLNFSCVWIKWIFTIPIPAPAGPMKLFMMALFATGYLMPIVKFIEIAVGICLLTNKFVPLS